VQIEISGHHHVEITDAIRSHVEDKAEQLARIFDGITTLHVAFNRERGLFLAEFVANVSRGAQVVAKVSADSLPAAIELAAEKFGAQLRRHKDKVRDHRVRASQPEAPSEEPDADDTDEEADEWETNPTTE